MMSNRRLGSKPTVALWMLVAVGDVALIFASAGMIVLIALASVVAVAVAVAAAWRLLHREVTGQERVAAPVSVPATSRRRA